MTSGISMYCKKMTQESVKKKEHMLAAPVFDPAICNYTLQICIACVCTCSDNYTVQTSDIRYLLNHVGRSQGV